MKKKLYMSSSQTIMIGFAVMILTGAFLLNLPIASQSGKSIGFLNALFTATSANCVTGLVVVNTMSHWTVFGKVVILALIQFGSLGFVTMMTLGMLITRRQINLRNRQAIQASFNLDDIGGMVKLVQRVVLIALSLELIGAILLAISFYTTASMPLHEAIYQGIFHAISAFGNAGFDNIGEYSLLPYQVNVPINLIITFLIIAGGLGFTVWIDIAKAIRQCEKKRPIKALMGLNLHSKIVLTVTGALIVVGTGLFLLFEWSNAQTMANLNPAEKVLAAFFQSVTLRTAGFFTIPQEGLTDISQFFSCILMIIGGSPASTAGGMKTVTIGIIALSMISLLKGKNRVEAFGRTLPLDLLQKALTVFGTICTLVLGATIALHFTEFYNPFPHTFLDLLFECSSAAGTVGVTTGITPHLSPAGKLIITFCMYLGRTGPITLVAALHVKLHTGGDGLKYPNERVIIG